MASKFAGVMHKLPPLPHERTNPYQEKVDERKQKMSKSALKDLATVYVHARARKDLLEAQLYEVNIDILAADQLLCESEQRHNKPGVEKWASDNGWGEYGAKDNVFKLLSGDSVRVDAEPYTTIENKREVLKFFGVEGDSPLLDKLAPGVKALDDASKDALLHGRPEIPGTKVWMRRFVVYTRAKQAKTAEQEAQSTDNPF